MRNILMKPLSHLTHWTSAVLPFMRPPTAARMLVAALTVSFAAVAETSAAAVPSTVMQEDRAFLENIAAGETGSPADVTKPAVREAPPRPAAKDEGPAVARTTHPERAVAEKPAPAPAPIASKPAKPKNVKREAQPAVVSETQSRPPVASARASTRKTDAAPIKPFYAEEVRVTAPMPPRHVEVERTEALDANDEDRESGPRRHRFFHRLFHGDD
jgi:hypothetical protein